MVVVIYHRRAASMPYSRCPRAARNIRKLRVMDLTAKISKSKRRRLRKRTKQNQWLVKDIVQPLKLPENKFPVFSLQEPKLGNVESLLDCSPNDLHQTIESLVAIKRAVSLDLIGKRRYASQEERYPSLVGCDWVFYLPNRW